MAPDFSNQIHDFNPGIAASGLFWTIPFPQDGVQVDFEDGDASMQASRLRTRDFFSFPSSLSGGSSVPATVSFDVQWDGDGEPVKVRDEKNRFAGDYIETTSSIEWSAREAGFRFKSDPETTNEFSEIGRERNGVFFS